MGRPSFRRAVLRDHGTERRKRLPTMGTAPKTQEQALMKNKIAWTPKGLFRHFAHPLSGNKAGQQDRQDRSYTIPYTIASTERIIADTHRTSKLAKGGFQGRRGEAVGHRPQCFKSLVICDSRFESQIAIAVKSRDLEHLARLPRAAMSMSWTNCTFLGSHWLRLSHHQFHSLRPRFWTQEIGWGFYWASTAYMGAFPPSLFGSDWFCPVLISQPSWLWGQHLCLSTVKRRWA